MRTHHDHYYWVTAFLAARGLRPATCRLIALIIVGSGVIPAVLTVATAGPHSATTRVGAAVIAVCCTAMSLLWLRHHWPSRAQSMACVAVGCVLLAVACLLEDQPVVGLLGSTMFVVLSAFATFFHSVRLLVVTWAVGAATLAVLAVRIAATELALAVCGVVMLAFINAFVAFSSNMVIRLISPDTHYAEIETLTGLLTREAFVNRMATLIGARSRTDDSFLAVIVIDLDSFSMLGAVSGAASSLEARIAVAHELQQTLRHDAVIAHTGEAEFLVADLFPTADCSVLTDRLLSTVTTAPFHLRASIGAVTTPLRPLVTSPAADVAEELLALSADQMTTARRAGGNQTRHLRCPSLTTLERPQDGWNDRSA